MPRLPPVPRADDNAPVVSLMYEIIFGDRDPIAEPGTDTGSPGDWWTAFANSPDVLEHAVQGFALYQNPARELDPVLRELAQARVGFTAQSRFVFSQHCKSLRGLGVSDDKIESLANWSTTDLFGSTERLVLAFADCIAYDHGRVPDALFSQLSERFSPTELMELTYITSLYLQHAVMSRALRTEFDDVDERITEIRVEGASDSLLAITADD